MPTLHITELHCVKKEDGTGRDEVEIRRVDGGSNRLLSGPHTMRKGQELALNEVESFEGSISLRLMEVDGDSGGDNDTILGNATMIDDEVGTGSHTKTFQGQPGADYHMRYRVDA